MWLQNRLIVNNYNISIPISPQTQLNTTRKVWELLLWEKVWNGSRWIVWRVASLPQEGTARKIRGVVKEYMEDWIKAMDQKTSEEIINRNMEIYKILKRFWIPTIPTLRKINNYSVFMTDLTEWWMYELVSIAWIYDWEKPLQAKNFFEWIKNISNKKNIKWILMRKLEYLNQKMKSAWISMDRNTLDWVFLRFKKWAKEFTEEDIEILLVDLDNVIKTPAWEVWGIWYDSTYYADLFISRLS